MEWRREKMEEGGRSKEEKEERIRKESSRECDRTKKCNASE